MSGAKPINLSAIINQAGVHNLLDMTEEKKAAQRRLDLYATMTMIASGFVSHPEYNTLVFTQDVEKFLEEIKDEFRELNGYVIEQFEKRQLLGEERYSNTKARLTLIEFGFAAADYFYKHGHYMSYKLQLNTFDDVIKKHYK